MCLEGYLAVGPEDVNRLDESLVYFLDKFFYGLMDRFPVEAC